MRFRVRLHTIFLLTLCLHGSYRALAAPPRSFIVGDRYPNKEEVDVCGSIRDVITRNSGRYRKILVRNSNEEIVYLNEDCRRITSRGKNKVDVLASKVKQRWNGIRLKVILAWTDQSVDGRASLHYEGRALRLQTSDGDKAKLGDLAVLAVESGFDWVKYETDSYIHASVLRDVCQTPIDLVFILDSSGSVQEQNFEKVKVFVQNVIDFFDIGVNGTHAAVVTFSTYPKIEFNLYKYMNKIDMKSAVSKIVYNAGFTYTADAVEKTRKEVFSVARPDKGIPKVAVLVTDGLSMGDSLVGPVAKIKKIGVNMFAVGVGNFISVQELKLIASDPDETHVFEISTFNDFSSWADTISSVSCDEGASLTSCDDTTTTVDSGSFKYFRSQFTVVNDRISIEVEDIKGISHLYASSSSKNPGPFDVQSTKNESDYSPKSVSLRPNANKLVFVAVQGQRDINQFKISMWDALFSKEYFQWLIKENSASLQTFRNTLSPLQNRYTLEYSIKAGNDHVPPLFTINKVTGEITLTQSLDREKQASYKLAIQATNKDNKCHKGRTWVTVVVEDVNDNSPKFPKTRYTAKVEENKAADTMVTVVTATDADFGQNALLKYSISSGDNSGDFRIDNQGRVFTMRPLDFEAKSVYTLTIKATDSGVPSKDSTTTLIISVEDVNESPAFISNCANDNSCTMSVLENSVTGTSLGSLPAADPDTGNCALVYTITVSDAQGAFTIDNRGLIKTGRVVDREVKETYQALVTVKDCGSPALEVSTQLTVNVLDRNDNDPVFSPSTYRVGFYENVQGGTIVTQVTASDADKGANAILKYSLTGGDTSSFVIDQNGVIKTAPGKRFDRESQASYTITVTAEDSGLPPRRNTAQVIVTVFDVNDNAPQFSKNPPKVDVKEDEALLKSIAKVSASDKDIGINADLRYSIMSGNEDGMFLLGPRTGVLTLVKQLDYETKKKYILQLRVTDRGLPAQFSERALEVNVLDVNDNSPLFNPTSYRATIKENSPRNTPVVRVTAKDQDSGNNGKLKYYITGGNTANTFQLHQDSGNIVVQNPPDFENPNLRQFDLQIEVRDQGSPPKTATANVRVVIEDVNDNAPKFLNTPYAVSINESTSVGSLVFTVMASDKDFGPRGQVNYRIKSGNDEKKFVIDGNTGKITIAASLDRETTDRYTLTVEAVDAGTPPLTAQAPVVITVTDANENRPLFTRSSYTFHVTEQSKATTLVGKVSATDKDLGENGRVTYSMSLNPSGMFQLDQNNGKITLAKEPDREDTSSYQFTVTASDQGNPSQKTSVPVTVVIGDLNDNAPKFTQSPYRCQVGENLAGNVPVCNVKANDPDEGLNGKVSYSITGGNVGNAFSINQNTGEISTTKTLNREDVSSYRLVITATDGAPALGRSTPHSVTEFAIINVLDENDNQPVFDKNIYLFNVSEDKLVGYLVGSVKANDNDAGSNGLINYSIVSGNTGSSFKISSVDGSITLAKSLDRETTANYQLLVKAKDSGKPALSATAVVKITIQDVNDNPPVFTSSLYTGEIREDASVGSTVLQVKAEDKDDGSNGKISYSLSGEGNSDFLVDSDGFIVSNIKLDYETKKHYNLSVTATDFGVPSKSSSANVFIKVVNVNDNAPAFNISGIIKIREDVAVDTEVVRFEATDADGDKLFLNFTSGNERGDFKIQHHSGIVQVAKNLDREAVDNYFIGVMVTDPSNQFTTQNLTILIEDANDNAPKFGNQSYAGSVLENSNSGINVVTVSATDRDLGSNAEITYSILSGDKTKFAIRSVSGEIYTTKRLDREQTPSYTLTVTAKDKGNPSLSSVVPVQITLLDENDNAPRFSQSLYAVRVMENTAKDTVVLRVLATDPDYGDNGKVRYTIIDGASSMFTIDHETGAIKVVQILDRETENSYTLKIQASDSGKTPNKVTVNAVITVGDENDNAPVITSQPTPFTVIENSALGTKIGTVHATDADEGSNGDITFSITDGNTGGAFKIDATSGVITVKGSIDHEKSSTFNLTVMAKDNGIPSLSSIEVFVVNVIDINDNAPVFDKKSYQAFVEENKGKNIYVVNITASDGDTGINAALSYSIVSGNLLKHFQIDPSKGFITTTASLDFEKVQSYMLTVNASDGKYQSSVQVKINVVNMNDNAPTFVKNPYAVEVYEDAKLLTSIEKVSATDLDNFGGIIYSIEGGHSKFSINPTSGVISTSDDLDRESRDSYEFTVTATDSGIPSMSGKTIVKVTILDVNDNPPVILPRAFTVSVEEGSAIGTPLTKLNATDRDIGKNGQVKYNISSESVPSTFSIDENTGWITTQVQLDAEQIRNYHLVCEATDQGNPKLTSNPVTITVLIEDRNDNTPQFQPPAYQWKVSEDVSVGTVVDDVFATDADSGSNGDVVYSIIAASDWSKFVIKGTTGIITTNASLDRELQDSYKLTVKAEDKGRPPRSSVAQVVITVTDVNDHQPQFVLPLSGSVKENKPANSFIMQLSATDRDIGSNALLTYSFENDQYKNTFSLNATTGEIRTKKELDRELQETYVVKVRVSDAGTPPLYSIADATITVIDEDDNCPTLDPKEYNVTISENSTVGTSVIKVYGKDKDVGAKLIYAIQSGNTRGAFQIEHGTGVIFVSNAGIDREETGEHFKLVIRAGKETCGLNQTSCTGAEGDGCHSTALPSLGVVYVTVTDVNDNPPKFTKDSYKWRYRIGNNGRLGSIEAKDPDLGDGGKVKYRMENQYQRGNTWFVTVVAYDLGQPSLESRTTIEVTTSEPCQAMVFFVSDRGDITTKTLCSFNTLPEGKELLLGEKHTLRCKAEGLPEEPQYRWQLNGRIVSDWLNHGNYEIYAATQNDEGSYACLASNKAGTIQSSAVQVSVYEKPRITKQPENTTAESGKTGYLECEGTGDPTVSYQWTKNGQKLLTDENVVNPQNATLIVRKIEKKYHEVGYVCRVTNSKGVANSRKAFIFVYNPQALVLMKIEVSVQDREGLCYKFNKQSFKERLSKYLGLKVFISSMKYSKSKICSADPCDSSPCQNGAQCQKQNNGGYSCLCLPGWRGDQCQIDINECLQKPCGSNGTCTNLHGTYICDCPPGMTGRNCKLRRSSCEPNPCDADHVCAMTTDKRNKCVNKNNVIVMVTNEAVQEHKKFEMEMDMENLIRAQLTTRRQKAVTSRRKRADNSNADYGSCNVQVVKIKDKEVHFVLLCPKGVNLDPVDTKNFVCGLLFAKNRTSSCGNLEERSTPAPPSATKPLVIDLSLFARDKNNEEVDSEQTANSLNEGKLHDQLRNTMGVEVKEARSGAATPKRKTGGFPIGAIVGIVVTIVVLALMAIFIAVLLYRRKSDTSSATLFHNRAMMNTKRRESKENILGRNVSFKDIARSEKKYMNKAYDNNEEDYDCDNFMIQVNLEQESSKKSALADLQQQPYYHGSITQNTAEMRLGVSMTPGTFLVRQGATEEEFILSVKCAPEFRQTPFRHLLIKHNKDGNESFTTHFGSIKGPRKFETMAKLIATFQIEPISFDDNSPDVILTNPWNKGAV